MKPTLTLAVVIVNISACLSLQFVSPPPDRPYDLFSSSRDSSHDVAVVIQSRPYNGSNATAPDIGKLRRNIVVEKEEDSEENYTEPRQIPQYAIDCGNDKACLEAHGLDYPEATFKPYTQEELERLLAKYTANHGNPPGIGESSPTNKLANLYMDDEEAVINVLESNPKNKDQEKSKSASWHLLNSQKNQYPYDDKKGWVTLEPVPWAQSQIQKWEPNAKPQIPTWDPSNHQRPSSSHWDARPSHDYSTERPWPKPSYEYKPSWSQWTRPEERPQAPQPPPHTSHWGPNPDIITDNQPGYFPGPPSSHRPWYDQEPYGSNKPAQTYEARPAHHSHPSTHPGEGDGQWVLLSSTKGYSVAHRDRGQYQRAFTFDTKAPAASVSSHRTVRLTVLPADNSTNTTLSHGGLLEVESTLQTVEEAQREHAAKMLKLNTLKPEDVRFKKDVENKPKSSVRANSRRSGPDVQVFSASPADMQSKTAVLAAVGAGLIPASMAVLLPMVLGRKRRSADSEEPSVNTTRLESVLHLHKSRQRWSLSRNE